MAKVFESPFLQLVLDVEQGRWSVFNRHFQGQSLEESLVGAHYRVRWMRFRALSTWRLDGPIRRGVAESRLGPMQQIILTFRPDGNGLRFGLTFGLPERMPLLLWRISVVNEGQHIARLEQFDLLQAGVRRQKRRRGLRMGPGVLMLRWPRPPRERGAVRPHPDPGTMRFFAEGWQSWSFAGSYAMEDIQRRAPFTLLRHPVLHNRSTPRLREPGRFAADMYGVLADVDHRTGLLVGFLSQQRFFGTLEARPDAYSPQLHLYAAGDGLRLEPGEEARTDWAALQFIPDLDDPDALAPYLDSVARYHQVDAADASPLQGWCSWYHFFNHMTAEDIRQNVQVIPKMRDRLPLEIVQVDDGYQAKLGEWGDFSVRFPDGVAPLAREIQEVGCRPGLWIAPFLAARDAPLVRQHPDWVLRNRWGLPVSPGYVFDTFPLVLDVTHPEVLAHLHEVTRRAVQDWGFDYLKLDFLYAAGLPGRRHDRTLSRAMALRRALEVIREAAGPQTTILGCGCPLGPAVGLVDAMRIGADVDLRWYPAFRRQSWSVFLLDFGMPAVSNALQNTLTRADLHRRWWLNDPDCLLLREETQLTLAEVQTWATAVWMSGGTAIVSDHLPLLSKERLRLGEQLFPLHRRRPWVPDRFDATRPALMRLDLSLAGDAVHLLAVFNRDDRIQDRELPLTAWGLSEGDWWAREFWTGALQRVRDVLHAPAMPPHGVRLFALRPVRPDAPQYLGSDLHISQGMEVTTWEMDGRSLRFTLERPRADGAVFLALPGEPAEVTGNGVPLDWEAVQSGVFRVRVRFRGRLDMNICY